MTSTEHLDVLIVGAGLSGIGAAAQLSVEHPQRSYAVLEARAASGGTWDLFRYPGVRSDSDMYTLGYRWRPWRGDRALADGPSILAYVRDVAREYAVDTRIRYGHRVVSADWDSTTARWTVEVDRDGTPTTLTAGFLWGCSGYYDYDAGYTPDFPGIEDYAGRVVHPQHWPEDLDHAGQRVVVIGSGATAVTLVPALAGEAAHVTMLQRSPSYVLSLPERDPVARRLARLPERVSFPVIRWKSILLAMASYQLSRKRPHLLAGADPEGHRPPAARRTSTSTRTSSRPTTRGTSGSAWSRTATCSRRCGGARPRSSPTPSRPSPSAASGSRPATSSRPTSWSRPRG